MNDISLFTTTFYDDFDLLKRLIRSIIKHIGTDYKHYIILNDDVSHLPELTDILSKFTYNTEIIHVLEFDEFNKPEDKNCNYGDRTLDGWCTQLMLTLLAAKKIKSEYYLHLCSKDFFTSKADIQKMIDNGKTMVPHENFMPLDYYDQFYEFFENACKILDVDVNKVKPNLIAPYTPVMNNTRLMKQLLDYLDEQGINIIDVIGLNNHNKTSCNKTIEYYLYSAWLTKMELSNNLIFYPQKLNIYNKGQSYNGRRKH